MLRGRLTENFKIVESFAPQTPSSLTPDYVSLKNYQWLTVVIQAKNATTVTGSAITLKQATAVAGTGEKALSFTKASRNIDTAASDTLAEFAVSSDTFTTDATNSKNLLYVIEVDPTTLDIANSFDCVRLGAGNATATVLSAIYILSRGRFGSVPSAIVD